MNATDFIKEHGLEHAKEQCAIHGWKNTSWWIQVKNLIQSHSYVDIHGLEQSKEIVNNAPGDDVFYSWTLGASGVKDKTVHIGTLRKAIADVEACQGAAQ